MLSINNPPVIIKNSNGHNKKKIYTINNQSSRLFNIRIKDKNEKELTTVLSFAKKIDALKVAALLEMHYLFAREWPDSLVDIDSNLILVTNHINYNSKLLYLSINTWNHVDFNQNCMNNLVDYLYITKFTKNNENSYNIKGQLVKILEEDIPCAQILNNIYNKS